jgi:hypothetical protein
VQTRRRRRRGEDASQSRPRPPRSSTPVWPLQAAASFVGNRNLLGDAAKSGAPRGKCRLQTVEAGGEQAGCQFGRPVRRRGATTRSLPATSALAAPTSAPKPSPASTRPASPAAPAEAERRCRARRQAKVSGSHKTDEHSSVLAPARLSVCPEGSGQPRAPAVACVFAISHRESGRRRRTAAPAVIPGAPCGEWDDSARDKPAGAFALPCRRVRACPVTPPV